MIKINKKIILIATISIIVVVSIIFYNLNTYNNLQTYNMNPDNSKKIIGSDTLMANRSRIGDLSELIDYTNLIIIGKVISSPVGRKETIGEEVSTIIKQKVPNANLSYDTSLSKVKIDKILYGKLDKKTNIITLCQLEPPKDIGETKVKKNEKMLMLLRKDPEEDIYLTADAENALFKISKKNLTTSLSDNIAVAKYDERHLDLLKKDLKKSIKKNPKNIRIN